MIFHDFPWRNRCRSSSRVWTHSTTECVDLRACLGWRFWISQWWIPFSQHWKTLAFMNFGVSQYRNRGSKPLILFPALSLSLSALSGHLGALVLPNKTQAFLRIVKHIWKILKMQHWIRAILMCLSQVCKSELLATRWFRFLNQRIWESSMFIFHQRLCECYICSNQRICES